MLVYVGQYLGDVGGVSDLSGTWTLGGGLLQDVGNWSGYSIVRVFVLMGRPERRHPTSCHTE